MGRGFKSFCPCQKIAVVLLRYGYFFVRGPADLKKPRYRANFRWTFATVADQAAQFAARVKSFCQGQIELSPSVLR